MIDEKASKAELYRAIDSIRTHLSISLDDYPINLQKIIKKHPEIIQVEEVAFTTPHFGGLIIRREHPLPNVVVLNANGTSEDQNFALAHEIVHIFCHPNQNHDYCPAKNHSWMDKQANEGAAELLMPFKLFIQYFVGLTEKES